jgi:nucleotide-binding universal stress UspA family protein
MKNILVLMHDDAGQEARLQGALDLTRALEGHLTCLDVALAPEPMFEAAGFDATAMLLADERASEAANRRVTEARLQSENLPFDWIDTTGFAEPSICAHAALADLIVLSRDIGTMPDMAEITADVLIKSHRPIVAMPADCRGFDVMGAAVVAWDGSSQAQSALRAAVPLLGFASDVTIVECQDGSVTLPAEAAATYLSRHGIVPTVQRVGTQIDIPSTILLDQVDARNAAYLVMGGFGHSRLMEAVLGGVSRRMLRECPVPVFMAH